MKRGPDLLEEKRTTIWDIHRDCLCHVFTQVEWACAGALARTCKHFMLLMTSPEVIGVIIHYIQQFPIGEKVLPHWTHFSLPVQYLPVPEEMSVIINQRVLPNCRQKMEFCPIKVSSGSNFCMAGGFLVKEITGKKWESDIDLFHDPGEWSRWSGQRRRSFGEWDIVEDDHHHRIEWVIDEFDLSICQFGYSHKDDQIYATPLAIYSHLKKKIIAMPTQMNINYINSIEVIGRTLLNSKLRIWNSIRDNSSHEKPFHELTTDIFPGSMKWCERVNKYRERFPDYEIYYCRPMNGNLTVFEQFKKLHESL